MSAIRIFVTARRSSPKPPSFRIRCHRLRNEGGDARVLAGPYLKSIEVAAVCEGVQLGLAHRVAFLQGSERAAGIQGVRASLAAARIRSADCRARRMMPRVS